MQRLRLTTAIVLGALATAAQAQVSFDWFEYRGHDATFEAPLPAGSYRNPVLAGFHADPAIVARR